MVLGGSMVKIRSSEITPESVYFSRRKFLKAMGLLAAGAAALAACGPSAGASPTLTATQAAVGAGTDELGSAITPFDAITNYNNYYEFTTSKEGVAGLAKKFVSSPW